MADRVLGTKHDGYAIPWQRTQQSPDPIEASATELERGIHYRDAIAIEQSPDRIDEIHIASGDECLFIGDRLVLDFPLIHNKGVLE